MVSSEMAVERRCILYMSILVVIASDAERIPLDSCADQHAVCDHQELFANHLCAHPIDCSFCPAIFHAVYQACELT